MIITKTLLTEILLEVTNEEIQHVAKEVHRKATRGLILTFPIHAPSLKMKPLLSALLSLNQNSPEPRAVGQSCGTASRHSLLMHPKERAEQCFSLRMFKNLVAWHTALKILPKDCCLRLSTISALTLSSLHLSKRAPSSIKVTALVQTGSARLYTLDCVKEMFNCVSFLPIC